MEFIIFFLKILKSLRMDEIYLFWKSYFIDNWNTYYSEKMGLVSIHRLWETERKQNQKRQMFIHFDIWTYVTTLSFDVALQISSKYCVPSTSKVAPMNHGCYIFQKLSYQVSHRLENTVKPDVSAQSFPCNLTTVLLHPMTCVLADS